MFWATMWTSPGETTVFMRNLVLVILCGWLSGKQEHMILHTRQSSTQNNKYKLSHKHSCFSLWSVHTRPKHVEIDKYTKNKYTKRKLYINWALFTWLYRDARPKKTLKMSKYFGLIKYKLCVYTLYQTPHHGDAWPSPHTRPCYSVWGRR